MESIANPPEIFESCLSHVTSKIEHPHSILDRHHTYKDLKTRYNQNLGCNLPWIVRVGVWVCGCVDTVKMGGCVWKRVRDRGTEDSFGQVETQVILVQQFFLKKTQKMKATLQIL
jgi:hypothetical protein